MDGLTPAGATVITRREGDLCYLQLHRPDADNAINDAMLADCGAVLRDCEADGYLFFYVNSRCALPREQ